MSSPRESARGKVGSIAVARSAGLGFIDGGDTAPLPPVGSGVQVARQEQEDRRRRAGLGKPVTLSETAGTPRPLLVLALHYYGRSAIGSVIL